MSSFKKNKKERLQKTTIKIADHSHIKIIDRDVCLQKCENKPCTYYCPSRVFYRENKKIKIIYERCLECGACPWGCPYNNIEWNFPPGGFGVIHGKKLTPGKGEYYSY